MLKKKLLGRITLGMGLLGIIIGIVLFFVLAYKGWSTLWVAPVCAIIVALFNQLDPLQAVTQIYVTGMTEVFLQLFSLIFMGVVFGKVYAETGAAASIATTLSNKFVVHREGDGQVKAAVLILIITFGLFTMGGIDGFVQIFTLFPIVMIIAENSDIPRKYVPALLCLGAPFMAAPGAPQHNNIMTVAALGMKGIETSPVAGVIPGIVAVLIIVTLSYFTLVKIILKAKANGEHFDKDGIHIHSGEGNELPKFWVALIPLLVVFVLFVVTHEVFIAVGVGIILTILLMFKYMTKIDMFGNEITIGKTIVNAINNGSREYPYAIISVVTPAGFAAVVTATAAFGMIVGMFFGLPFNIFIVAIIVVSVVVAVTSSPPAAIFVAIPIILEMIGIRGMIPNVPGITRVVALAATTFETLPANGFVLLILGMSKISHKEGYLPVFLVTVAYTLVGTIVAALLFIFFPGLA